VIIQSASLETGLVDEILLYVCERLQLTDTQHADAVRSYQAVGEWLQAPGSPFYYVAPTIYPQGSMALGTTVKPRHREEFDLDLVLDLAGWSDGPLSLYQATLDRLRSHRDYAARVEPLRRCIRLHYAGQFHLDVLPARRDLARGGTCIEVPDRTLGGWKPSNPKGFRGWFEVRSELRGLARMEQEPVPGNGDARSKTALQRAVQLLKRRRDVVFAPDADEAPRSVLLTTLAGEAFKGSESTAVSLLAILEEIEDRIKAAWPGHLDVANPTNPDERFSEIWEREPGGYPAFVDYVRDFRERFAELLHRPGLESVTRLVGELFGEEVAQAAARRVTERFRAAKDTGRLTLGTAGILASGPAGRQIRPHSFYGR
jgi:hypothetical protein